MTSTGRPLTDTASSIGLDHQAGLPQPGTNSNMKKLAQNEPICFKNPLPFPVMKKRTVPPTKVGRRTRRSFETSQKKVREAIDAALKRKLGDDGFKPSGAFGRARRAKS
jgi:hypothetical protein